MTSLVVTMLALAVSTRMVTLAAIVYRHCGSESSGACRCISLRVHHAITEGRSVIRNPAQGGRLSPCGPDGGHLQAYDAEQCCSQPFRGDKLVCPTEFCRSDMQGV